MNMIFAAVVLIGAVGTSTDAAGGDHPSEHKISVTGTAVTQTVPDFISWSISTVDESVNLVEAKESSDKKLNSVLSLARALDVKPEDIQTGNLNITREYNLDDKGRRLGFKCFSVRRGVTLKQRDLKRFDEFLTKLIAGAELEVYFTFESTRMAELRWDTRLKAMKLAKDKAEALAQIAGAKVGKAISISEPGPASNPFGVYPSNIASNAGAMIDPQAAHPADITQGTFAPGSMEIKVTIEAVFELE